MKTRVVIIDDHPMWVEGLTALVGRIGGTVVGVADAAPQILELVRRHAPVHVLLDMTLGRQTALPLVAEIVSCASGVRVTVLSAHASVAMARQATEAGACAYLTKSIDPSVLERTLRTVFAETPPENPIIELGPRPVRTVGAPGVSVASDAQRRVLRALNSGMSQAEVGDHLGISRKTVEYHLQALRHKTGLRTTAQLLVWARETDGQP